VSAPEKCPYCPGLEFDPWLEGVTDRLGIAPGTYTFWRCRACDSGVLHPAPKPEELAALYPEVYSFHPGVAKGGKLKGLIAGLEERFFFQLQYQAQYKTMAKVMGRPGPGARLLDVGCGVGQRLQAFRKIGYDVHGLDFLPSVVEHLRKELGIEATCGDLGQLDQLFPEQSFDVVTAFQVVEHVHDARAMLGRCLRLLRPRGWFMATIPMGDSLQARWLGTRWCGVREAPRHLNLPSHEGLRQACRSLGFDRVEILPDSLLNCAGLVGLSLLPDAATTTVYAQGSARAVVNRVLGAAVTVGSLPLCYLEGHVAHRPATALVFAQKPA
jgi:ubiquinone/menaquinone biosynthesis C-methylase UbiE